MASGSEKGISSSTLLLPMLTNYYIPFIFVNFFKNFSIYPGVNTLYLSISSQVAVVVLKNWVYYNCFNVFIGESGKSG